MTEQECLDRMVAPGTPRAGKYRQGVIQIHITRACDKSCFNCTQASNVGGKTGFMLPDHFEQAVRSLGFDSATAPSPSRYFGVVGVFGGNPALSPHFSDYCAILHRLVPYEQRGIWCNNPVTLDKAKMMRATFCPGISNLNVHLDQAAYDMFKMGWPECSPVGLHQDSRHSPVFVAMKDVITKEVQVDSSLGGFEINIVPNDSRIWELISTCDINQHWSAMIGVFRGELRAWFCEVAGAQAMLHQDEPDYPDTGVRIIKPDFSEYQMFGSVGGIVSVNLPWWKLTMSDYATQVRKHCFDCGVPLRGYGELAQGDGKEQVSQTHASVLKPKRKGRQVEVVTELVQLGIGRIAQTIRYLQNAKV